MGRLDELVLKWPSPAVPCRKQWLNPLTDVSEKQRQWLTFSLYSTLMMEQFRLEEGSSGGMLITWVAVSLQEGAMGFIFSFRTLFMLSLLRPCAKKLLFSYTMNFGFTARLDWLLISMFTFMSSPWEQKTLGRHSGQGALMLNICCWTCSDVTPFFAAFAFLKYFCFSLLPSNPRSSDLI